MQEKEIIKILGEYLPNNESIEVFDGTIPLHLKTDCPACNHEIVIYLNYDAGSRTLTLTRREPADNRT